jgi:hypothetical protein
MKSRVHGSAEHDDIHRTAVIGLQQATLEVAAPEIERRIVDARAWIGVVSRTRDVVQAEAGGRSSEHPCGLAFGTADDQQALARLCACHLAQRDID